MEKVIEQIRMKRHTEKLTQAQVDRGAKLSVRTMHKFEKGQVRNVMIIEKIARFFGGEIVIDFSGEASHEAHS